MFGERMDVLKAISGNGRQSSQSPQIEG
jgi:ATP-binding cassette subfamily C protein